MNSLPAFAAIISQLVMMSVLEHCIWQKRSAADKSFLVYLKSCSCRLFAQKTYSKWRILPGII